MKYLGLLISALLSFSGQFLPALAAAPADAWADSVYTYSGTGVDNPNNALGPADGQTTNMVGVQKFITLDMGEGEEGIDSLRAYFGQVLIQTDVQVVFLDASLNAIASANRGLSIATSSQSIVFPYNYASFNRPYRYVRVNSLAELGFSLDAVEALNYNRPTVTPPTPPPPSCQSDTWTCGEWTSCSTSGQETRSCVMTTDCPGVATPSPALTRQCIPPSSNPTTPPPSSSQSQSYYYYYYSDTNTQAPAPTTPAAPTTPTTPTTPRPPATPAAPGGSASADVTAPEISNVQAITLDPTTEKITWNTNELADGGVEYGPEGGVMRFTPVDPTMTMDHAAWLSELKPNTAYVFRVYSRDAAGNLARSPESHFVTPSHGLGNALNIDPWFTSLGWCGWLNLLLILLLIICAASAGYWHNEAKRLSKKVSKKTS